MMGMGTVAVTLMGMGSAAVTLMGMGTAAHIESAKGGDVHGQPHTCVCRLREQPRLACTTHKRASGSDQSLISL